MVEYTDLQLPPDKPIHLNTVFFQLLIYLHISVHRQVIMQYCHALFNSLHRHSPRLTNICLKLKLFAQETDNLL